MPTTINRNKDLVVKCTDLGTVSILYIISIAKWDTKQVHACKMHGSQLRWHVHMSSEKSLECEWCSLDHVFKPQSSYVFKWTYFTIIMWQIQKTRISLSITWNSVYFPKRNKITYFIWVWNWCSCIEDKINSSTSIGNMLHRAAKHIHILLHLSVNES